MTYNYKTEAIQKITLNTPIRIYAVRLPGSPEVVECIFALYLSISNAPIWERMRIWLFSTDILEDMECLTLPEVGNAQQLWDTLYSYKKHVLADCIIDRMGNPYTMLYVEYMNGDLPKPFQFKSIAFYRQIYGELDF